MKNFFTLIKNSLIGSRKKISYSIKLVLEKKKIQKIILNNKYYSVFLCVIFVINFVAYLFIFDLMILKSFTLALIKTSLIILLKLTINYFQKSEFLINIKKLETDLQNNFILSYRKYSFLIFLHKNKLPIYLAFLLLSGSNSYLFLYKYYFTYQIINVFLTLIFISCSAEFILFNKMVYKTNLSQISLNKRFVHSQVFAKGVLICRNCAFGATLAIIGPEVIYKTYNGPFAISPWRQTYLNYSFGTNNIKYDELTSFQARMDFDQNVPVTGRPLNFNYSLKIKGESEIPVLGSASHDVSISGEVNLGSGQIKDKD